MRDIEFQTYGETVINPIALLLTLSMGMFILMCKRQYIIIAFLTIATFITSLQRIVIAGLDFNMIRIIALFGFIRVILTKEYLSLQLTKIDKYIFYWSFWGAVLYIARLRSSGAVIYQLGNWFNVIGLYYLIRMYVRNRSDVIIALKTIAVFSFIMSIFMIYEQLTRRNLFAVFGGVREITWLRAGKLRSQGSFSHSIMAGSYGASMFPVMMLYYYFEHKRNNVFIPILGIIGSTVICLTSNSSGPLLSILAGAAIIFTWKYRYYYKRYLLRVVLIVIVAFEVIAPGHFWMILSLIDLTGGSTGSHRALLINAAVNRFSEWFLYGVNSTAHWGWGLQDVTNMYILQGVRGGVLTAILFTIIIVLAYKKLTMIVYSNSMDEDEQKYAWLLIAALTTHVVSFIGVSYFGQMEFFYLLLFAFLIAFFKEIPEGKRDFAVSFSTQHRYT